MVFFPVGLNGTNDGSVAFYDSFNQLREESSCLRGGTDVTSADQIEERALPQISAD